MNTTKQTPLQRLRHHVTGAIERGEKTPIVEKRIDNHPPLTEQEKAHNEGAAIISASYWPKPSASKEVSVESFNLPSGRYTPEEMRARYAKIWESRSNIQDAAGDLAEALRMACRVIEGENLDEAMSGEYEILTDALNRWEKVNQ